MPTLATLPPSPLTLCLLGTGNMGLPMARRLAQAGYPMRVWNRTQAKAEVLAADGAVICATPRQACTGADITLSLLEPTVQAVAFFFHEKAWARREAAPAVGAVEAAPEPA